MNRHLFSRRRVVGALSAAGAIAALTPASVQAQEATIRIVYNTLKTHPIGQFFETLAQEIEKNTATTSVRLKTRTFPNGQLFADMQIPDAVSTGTVEIGQVTLALANSPDAVASQIGMLPLLWNSWEALWYAEDHDDAWLQCFQPARDFERDPAVPDIGAEADDVGVLQRFDRIRDTYTLVEGGQKPITPGLGCKLLNIGLQQCDRIGQIVLP